MGGWENRALDHMAIVSLCSDKVGMSCRPHICATCLNFFTSCFCMTGLSDGFSMETHSNHKMAGRACMDGHVKSTENDDSGVKGEGKLC